MRHGWEVEKIGPSLILVRKFPLVGVVMIMKRGDPATSVDAIEDFARRRKTRLTKLDIDLDARDERAPAALASLSRLGFIRSRLPLCPTKTIRIDTTLSLTQLLSEATSDVRQHLRQNEKGGFVILKDRDLGEFYPVLRQAARKKRYYLPGLKEIGDRWKSFGSKLKILIGYKAGEVLGGAMLVCHQKRAAGIYMAFTETGLKCHLPYSLMWECVRTVKENGGEVFDLDGIYDERFGEPSAWKGLSVFKSKFGGSAVEFLGTFVKCRFLPTRLLAGLKVI